MGGVCFCLAVGELAIDPDGQVLQVHPLGVVVVQHVGHYLRHPLPIIFLNQQHSLVDDLVQDVVVVRVVALLTRQQGANFQQDHAQSEHIALFQNILLYYFLLATAQGDDQFGRGQYWRSLPQFLICVEADEFIGEEFEVALIVEDVLGIDVLIGDSVGLQMCQCVDDPLDQSVDVFRQEELVGMQAALQELSQGELYCLQEEDFLFGLDLDAVLEGSGLQFEHSFAFHPARERSVASGSGGWLVGGVVVDVAGRGLLGELRPAILLAHYQRIYYDLFARRKRLYRWAGSGRSDGECERYAEIQRAQSGYYYHI